MKRTRYPKNGIRNEKQRMTGTQIDDEPKPSCRNRVFDSNGRLSFGVKMSKYYSKVFRRMNTIVRLAGRERG